MFGDFDMRGDRLPTRGSRFQVSSQGETKFENPPFFRTALQEEDHKRSGYGRAFLFETRIGDVRFDSPPKKPNEKGVSEVIKFAQVYIIMPGTDLANEKRQAMLVITAYLSQSNSKTHGNPTLKLPPEKQELGSLAMLRRSLKTDPKFLIKVFKRFAPQAFQATDKSSYYSADGKTYPMRIVFDVPGANLVDFETEFVAD